jgi:hypothetical protein
MSVREGTRCEDLNCTDDAIVMVANKAVCFKHAGIEHSKVSDVAKAHGRP